VGDKRAASSFYHAAVSIASQVKDLPPPIRTALQRAADFCERVRAEMEAHIAERLSAAGFRQGASSGRFAESIDLLTGRRQVQLQQPRAYYFPGLPQVAFYPREQFPWLDAIEAETAAIRAEFEAAAAGSEPFEPYVRSSPDLPLGGSHPLLDSLNWSAFFLYKNGHLVAENAARCPRTMAALANAPLPSVKDRDPMALFSVLRPGIRIAPHHGFLNTRLICHLPLIVPPGCYLRVGNDRRELQTGRAYVFDDSIKHEAQNPSDSTRAILIFDIWRPELTEDERRLVTALLEAVDTFGTGPRSEWID
jgi:aspartyl/asparaginyl beta-hydroxylase (cupin superfamily)